MTGSNDQHKETTEGTGTALTKRQLPALQFTPESNLSRYLQEIRKFPMLEREEEFMLAKRWRDHGDVEAAHKLVTSHLRLVAKIAVGYRGYGLPLAELISEGNVGMMQAVKKFDPDRGFRLATYAMWWIKAAIQEYILHSWSLVKIGTTAAQKKLFFNLRKLKSRLQQFEEGDLPQESVSEIADALSVPEKDVIEMNRRLAASDGAEGRWRCALLDGTSAAQAERAAAGATRLTLGTAAFRGWLRPSDMRQELFKLGGDVPSVLNGGLGDVPVVFWISAVAVAVAAELAGIQAKESGKMSGDLGFRLGADAAARVLGSPAKVAEAEIVNGRVAMLAVTAYVVQEFAARLSGIPVPVVSSSYGLFHPFF